MEYKLSGKFKYRKSLFGKIILQVEIEYYDDMLHGGCYRKEFRDAKDIDLIFLPHMMSEFGHKDQP